jgi:hypothetical protein
VSPPWKLALREREREREEEAEPGVVSCNGDCCICDAGCIVLQHGGEIGVTKKERGGWVLSEVIMVGGSCLGEELWQHPHPRIKY